jgi:hypothetical protein
LVIGFERRSNKLIFVGSFGKARRKPHSACINRSDLVACRTSAKKSDLRPMQITNLYIFFVPQAWLWGMIISAAFPRGRAAHPFRVMSMEFNHEEGNVGWDACVGEPSPDFAGSRR